MGGVTSTLTLTSCQEGSECVCSVSSTQVITQSQATFSADVWSVACVLVEMLTASLPGCHKMQRDQNAMIYLVGGARPGGWSQTWW